MTVNRGLTRTIIRRALPLQFRSYLTRRPSAGIDRTVWDKEYAAGEWSKLGKRDEMPRYAIIAGYSKTIGQNASVLDVGCGEGHLANWLLDGGNRRYVGVDLSQVAIEQARARAQHEARFEVGDAATFDPGECFDIIVLNEVLYYMSEPAKVLQHYEGFLTPGGVLIISMYRVPESLSTWRRCASRLDVLESVRLRGGATETEWNVWLCQPQNQPSATRH